MEAGGTYGLPPDDPGYQFNAWKLYNYAPVNWHISSEPNNRFMPDIYMPIAGAVQCPYDGDITIDNSRYRNTTRVDDTYNDNPLSIGSDTTVVKLSTRGFLKIKTADTAGAGMPFSKK
mgnify:FL=1